MLLIDIHIIRIVSSVSARKLKCLGSSWKIHHYNLYNVCIYRKVLYVWILFFGSAEEARNYSCRISIKDKLGNEFNYSGPVHTLDKTEKAFFIFFIGSSAAKQMMDKEYNLKIQVTIQNQKSAISTDSKDFYEPDSDSSLELDSFLDSAGNRHFR